MSRFIPLVALTGLMVTAPIHASEDFTIEPRGRIFIDVAQFEEDFALRTNDTSDSEFRAARIGVQGGWQDFRYVAEIDFGGEKIAIKDAAVTWSQNGLAIRVGHFKTPNSIEYNTSGRYITFMERSQASNAFRYGRRLGVQLSRGGDNYSLAFGVFGGSVGDDSTDFHVSDSSTIAARASFAPVLDDRRALHLGIHARLYNEGGDGAETLRVRARPGVHLANRYVDARPAANNSTLMGVEAAWIDGPFHALFEAAVEDSDEGGSFSSWSASAGWFLSGERRNYQASSGTFRRISVASPVTEGGMGAFEVAGRFDYLDAGIAGEQTALALALNWYPTDHTKLGVNVIHGEADGAGARFGEGDINAIQARFQFDW